MQVTQKNGNLTVAVTLPRTFAYLIMFGLLTQASLTFAVMSITLYRELRVITP